MRPELTKRNSLESGTPVDDDDKYNKPSASGAEEEWMGMPVSVLRERMGVLTGLMVVQSLSGIILGQFEELIPCIRAAAAACMRDVRILGDIQGPKFRCSLTQDDAPVPLAAGEVVEFGLATSDVRRHAPAPCPCPAPAP